MVSPNNNSETDARKKLKTSEESPLTHFSLIPLRHTKVVHLIRHGQGEHNVAVENAGGDKSLYKSDDYFDAQLTAFGWEQATALKNHIKQLSTPLDVELVVVSPLSRTLQTAAAVFGSAGAPTAEGGAGGRGPLMTATAKRASLHVSPAESEGCGISSEGCPPILAYEGCREQLGEHPCDKRRSLTYYLEHYPAVDFSLVKTDEDVLWHAHRRETIPEIEQRAVEFVQWLSTRPEKSIAVVAHSAFFTRGLLPQFGDEWVEGVRDDMRAYMQNCEMRSFAFIDGTAGTGGLHRKDDPLFFPGGKDFM